jgi:hypothetical protein
MEAITHDLFDVSTRIKDIDADYTICRNSTENRFEVYWHGLFAFVVPFDCLDERTLVYTQKTRRERDRSIEREIDEGNDKIEQEKQKNIDLMKAKIKDYTDYYFANHI